MAVTLTVGQRQRRAGTFQASEDLAQSTATTAVVASITTDVSTVAGGTATGATLNRVSLAAGVEGQIKSIVNLATGETWLDLAGGTATNFLIPLRQANDYFIAQYLNAGWKMLESNVGAEITASGVTGTGLQTINAGARVVRFTQSTGTGFGLNRWALAAANEGAEKFIALTSTATGEIKLVLTGGTTSTGDLVLSTAGSGVLLRYLDAIWRLIVNSGATIATATGTA